MFPRVKDILNAYDNGGIIGVSYYFEQPGMEVDPNTWSGKIKKQIDLDHKISVTAEIELLIEKFKKYENVPEKENSRTRTTPSISERDKNI